MSGLTPDNGKDIETGLKELEKRVVANLTTAVNAGTALLVSHFKENVFIQGSRGATPVWGHIQNRTGALRNSLRTLPAEQHFGSIQGRVTIGTPYAGVHFGPQGQSTHIVPKNKQYLAIPLPAAQGNYGESIGGTHETREGGGYQSSKWSTFIMMSKAGNLIIWGRMKYTKGANAGKTGKKNAFSGDSGIVPLFLLRKFVDVPTHVDANEELQKLAPSFDKMVKEAFNV